MQPIIWSSLCLHPLQSSSSCLTCSSSWRRRRRNRTPSSLVRSATNNQALLKKHPNYSIPISTNYYILSAKKCLSKIAEGEHDHDNALLMVKTYGFPDPYVTTEMEDLAVAQAVKRAGMLDRLITLRSSVNMDVFMDAIMKGKF